MYTLLRGRRTYLVVLAMLVYAGLGLALGKIEDGEAMKLILEALAVAGLRAGIANKE